MTIFISRVAFLTWLCLLALPLTAQTLQPYPYHFDTTYVHPDVAAESLSDTPVSDKFYTNTYYWHYAGQNFSITMGFLDRAYLLYRGIPKTFPWAEYATETWRSTYLSDVAHTLNEACKDMKYNDRQFLEYLVSFVQQAIPYTNDPVFPSDYPKFPIETLVEKGGDCEDKAALLAALMETFGYDSKLFHLPGHMGVALYDADRDIHFFIETTGTTWRIGDIPNEHYGQWVKIYDVKRCATYDRDKLENYQVGTTLFPKDVVSAQNDGIKYGGALGILK